MRVLDAEKPEEWEDEEDGGKKRKTVSSSDRARATKRRGATKLRLAVGNRTAEINPTSV